MTARTRRIWFAAIILVVVAACIVAWRASEGTTGRVVLPDGRWLALRAMTVGTNSAYVAGNLFQRTVGRMLPATLKARFKIREMQVRPEPSLRGTDLLVTWVETYPGTNTMVARIADDSGHEQPATRANASGGNLSSGAAVSAHAFSSFPRRSRSLTVRVYSLERQGMNKWAEFRVRNPAYRKYPAWKGEPLPIVRETNGLKFTITDFNTGLSATGHLASTSSNWTEIIYDYDAGPWRPVEITVSDATGNRFYQRPPMGRIISEAPPSAGPPSFDTSRRGMVSLPTMLWLDEPAWKVQLQLERYQRNSFGSNSNTWWEVKDVAVPARGETNRINLPSPGYGTNIIFKSVAVIATHVRVELQRPRGSDLLVTLLSVTDQRGANIFFTQQSPVNSDTYLLQFATADARTLNFRFAIHSRVTLEFLARPRLLHRSIFKNDEW